MKAADVMVTEVITARPDDRVDDIARVLLANGISAVPVVGDSGELAGIVSEGDLMRRLETGTEHRRSWWLDLLTTSDEFASEYVKEHGMRAADVMTRKVISVAPDASLGEVANLLEANKIKRVPVVENGQLVGLVSRANLVQALAALQGGMPAGPSPDDAAIREALKKRLKSEPWAPRLLNVIVKDGNVGLWGVVRSDDQKDAARIAAESMAGVKSVDNNILVMRAGMMGTD
jgi:CBS domain-containing protein